MVITTTVPQSVSGTAPRAVATRRTVSLLIFAKTASGPNTVVITTTVPRSVSGTAPRAVTTRRAVF